MDGGASVDAEIDANGQVQLKIGDQGHIDQLAGEVLLNGQVGLTLAQPEGERLEVPVSVNGTASMRMTSLGAFCLDAHATVVAPIKVQRALLNGRGQVDADIVLDGKTNLSVGLPSGHGQLQATGVAKGPVSLAVSLPDRRGYVRAKGTIRMPVTIAAVLPEGRAKLGAEGMVDSDVEAGASLPDTRGRIEVRGTLKGPASIDLIIPEGQGRLKAAAPIRAVLRLKELAFPNLHTPLDLDVNLNGVAELAIGLPECDGQLRLRLNAAIPLAPVLRLVRTELEQHVQVERMRLHPPRLVAEKVLVLPLYVEARKGVLAKVEVTTELHLDPETKQLVLWEIVGRGANAAGQAASRLYLNRRLFRPLKHMVLFDPATMLPPATTLHSLCFRSADTEAVGLVADVTLAF